MRRILTIGFVALMTAATVATSSIPASAAGGHGHGHGWHGKHGGHRWHHGHRWDRRIFFDDGHFNPWRAHVRWCARHHHTFDASTNLFLTPHGHWRRCRSPFR